MPQVLNFFLHGACKAEHSHILTSQLACLLACLSALLLLLLPQVESFLHGPSETFNLSGCSGIAQARRAASDVQAKRVYGYSASNSKPITYSITATAQGTGRNACVVIRKTKEYYELQVKARQLLGQELVAVRRLVRAVPGAAAAPAAAAAAATAAAPAAAAAAENAEAPAAAPAAAAAVRPVVESINLTED
jgi:hypothetical protein